MAGKSTAAQIAVASYIAVRGAVGATLLLLSRAPESAGPVVTLSPVLAVGGTLLLVSYGVLEGRHWGWIGALSAALILTASNILLAVMESISSTSIILADAVLLGLLLALRSSIDKEEPIEKVTLENL